MYTLHLRTGKRITSAMLQKALGDLQADCGTATHATRMTQLAAIERLEARGMQYSNQDFDVLSGALNFLDAVMPEHGLRDRFIVTTQHGERETIYHVVDSQAPDGEQPAIIASYSTKSYSSGARSCAEYSAEVHNGRGYKGDPAYINALARSR